MNRKVRKASKPRPAILREPIQAGSDEEKQREARISAVYAYYGVNENAAGGSAQLIAAMSAQRFPAAFRIVPKGTPRTKRPTWTLWRKLKFLDFMDNHGGPKLRDAAQEYRDAYCPERSSIEGLVAEYYRVAKWRDSGRRSELEHRELDEWARDYFAEMKSNMQRGK